ncbi:alpha/beta fold hydrolase [Candidatus Bathyarchaeota archaeon]|nr:alpha/beta fold hydrolase [Candidatus Bathyarchaeota archaeon]
MPSLSRLALGLLLAAPASTTPIDPLSFDWSSITPSPALRYQDCYPGHQCARLTVPLDWLDPSNAHTATIAIVKRPASVPPTDPTYGGPVLLNPGGPGGSGVDIALRWGERIQNILDGKKHYEIIGFDPRGVGRTTPGANCYPDELTRAYEVFQAHGAGYLTPDNDKLTWRHALAKSFGKRCGEALGGDGGILRYASSSSVARDMVEIIDQIQELQNAEEEDALGAQGVEQKKLRGSKGGVKAPARLQYMGFSYGTLLGNTFASMFPGRVGRMVLDGVADIDDYMAGVRH